VTGFEAKMHLLFNPVWKLVTITSQLMLGLGTYSVSQRRIKQGTSYLTSNDSGLLVFETPKHLVILEAINVGIAFCSVELIFWIAPTGGQWQLWASLVLALVVLERMSHGVHGPKRVEIDNQTGKYCRHNGWLKRVITGKNTDIVGVTVTIDKPQRRIDCDLTWVRGNKTFIGLWPYSVETKQQAMDLAELVRETINVPVTVKEAGKAR
jgi:hypothetical protein